ncbi:hypothetical protein EXE43_24565, partial [Halorubrum sp. SS5]
MLAVDYLLSETKINEADCTVYRTAGGRSYDSSDERVGETAIWLFDASASSNVVTEGTEEETSFTGLLRPSCDLQDGVRVGDELTFDGHPERRYEVRTKVGVP